jgi:hypothetical protein
MRSRVMLLVVVVSLIVVSCGSGESTDTSPSATAATTSAPSTAMPVASTSTTLVVEPAGYTVETDIAFATYNGEPFALDLYVPADSVGAPILVTEGFEEVERFVDEGVIVVDLAGETEPEGMPTSGSDQPMQDNRVPFRITAEWFGCAIRFAREQAAGLGNDDPAVALMSLSVGGGFAAHVALFGADLEAGWDEFAAAGGPTRQIECATTGGSTDVDGLIGVAGAYDFLVPIYEGLYGLSYQREQDPEFQAFLASAVGRNPDLMVRLFHDPADGAIPLENSTMFENALAAAGYDVELITFDGGHSYPTAELIVPALMEVLGR